MTLFEMYSKIFSRNSGRKSIKEEKRTRNSSGRARRSSTKKSLEAQAFRLPSSNPEVYNFVETHLQNF